MLSKLEEEIGSFEADPKIAEKVRALEADPKLAERIRAIKTEPSLAVIFYRAVADRPQAADGRPFTPELKEAMKITRSRVFTRENWIKLNVLAEADDRIGDLMEGFIVACPDIKVWRPLSPKELAENGIAEDEEF